MSSPLYDGRFLSKNGAVVQYRLTIIHPDVSEFGTDAYFAWKLLSDWVSPDDPEPDDVGNAKKFIKSVKLSKVENATVAKKAKDFFSVKRKGKKDPSVVYTITVTDAALLKDVKVGDGDEVYQYVEPGAGAKKPAKKPAAAKGKKGAVPAAIEPKTFDDLRETTFELIESNGRSSTWSEYVVKGYLLGWSRTAPDADLKRWISHLEKAWQIGAAGFVGLQRQKDGKIDSAKEWKKLAESLYDPKDDYESCYGLPGLIPLWWRLGEVAKADKAFASFRTLMENGNGTGARETIVSVAAHGGRADLVETLLPQAFAQGSYGADYAVPGLMSALERGEEKISTAILKRWSEGLGDDRSTCSELSSLLVRTFRDDPKRVLELLLAYPKIIDEWQTGPFALRELERRDPKEAVVISEAILANEDFSSFLQLQALALMAAHAPAQAQAWESKNAKLAKAPEYLAALGKNDQARAALKKKDAEPRATGQVTSDHALAVDAWKKDLDPKSDLSGDALAALVDLGERALADDLLEKRLAVIGKLAAKDRDLRCRYFASAAVTAGRADLAFAACKLPTNAVRQYSARDLAAAAAKIGDYGAAMAALELVPDGDSNGRVSAAVQGLVRGAEEGPFNGPRAMPMRVASAIYARSLIARGDRAAVEWYVVATKGKLPNEAQVEIDAFLEKGAAVRASG